MPEGTVLNSRLRHMFRPEGVSAQGSPVDRQRAARILGGSDNVPQSQEQHAFSQPQFSRERCRLPFLFMMTKGHCLCVPGLTWHCITADSQMVGSLHPSTLEDTQDVMAEVAADAHPRRTQHLHAPGSPGVPSPRLPKWAARPWAAPLSQTEIGTRPCLLYNIWPFL